LALVLLFLTAPAARGFSQDEIIFKKGLEQYKIGSYSTALDYFLKLLKPSSPYYKDSLLMLAKVYYAIGQKSGMKKYLWQALNYLQLYFIEMGEEELPWEYYFTKAKIYEALSFYEQALAIYRVAFLKAKTAKEKIRTTIGIIRTAVWTKKFDVAEEYFILTSYDKLSPEEEKELTFVKGLFLFSQGKYKEALPFFLKLYKKYEEYLIDNPEYYLLVAENIYRLGNLKLAEQLFRRIVSLTRDKEAIRRAMLRLGDIELGRGELKLAFVYYYSVIRDYPDSTEAIVARLKIIPLMKYPDVKYRAMLSGEKAFKEPIKYIASVLVNYRTTYVGIYALADLGYLVFKLDSPENVFERLLWEVSLIFPEEVKYEQREFLRYLWEPFLLKLPPEKACKLYRSNPRLFRELFGREVLLKFALALKSCNMKRLRLELLQFMAEKWKSDEDRILMAEALYESRDFDAALSILEKVKNKKRCDYSLLAVKLSLFKKVKELPSLSQIKLICKGKDRESEVELKAVAVYYLTKTGNIKRAFKIFSQSKEELTGNYRKELLVKAALDLLLKEATLKGEYDVVYQVAKELYEKAEKSCKTGSYLLLSAVRLGKLDEETDSLYKEVSKCIDPLSKVAVSAYESLKLEREVKDGNI
jgi:tetratricopeptide (TPR) repeat protein